MAMMKRRAGSGLAALLLLASAGCGGPAPDVADEAAVHPASAELLEMFDQDQSSRISISDEPLAMNDADRRRRVMELLAGGQVVTAEDKFHAATILQHTNLQFCGGELASTSPENYYLANRLAAESLRMGFEDARGLVAETLDRYLLYTEGQQKYGTQRVVDPKTGKEMLAPIDPETTDAERAEYGVAPLADLLKRHRMQKQR
jgi:hypothetical protein